MPLLGLVPESRPFRVSARCRENGFWPPPSRSDASRSGAIGLGSTGCMQQENIDLAASCSARSNGVTAFTALAKTENQPWAALIRSI